MLQLDYHGGSRVRIIAYLPNVDNNNVPNGTYVPVYESNYTYPPQELLWTPFGNKVYVIERELGINGTLHVIDGKTFKEVSNCTLNGDSKRGYAVDNSGRLYYSTSNGTSGN